MPAETQHVNQPETGDGGGRGGGTCLALPRQPTTGSDLPATDPRAGTRHDRRRPVGSSPGQAPIAVVAVLDAIMALVLVLRWVFWSSRMLVLSEKLTNMAGQRLEFAREAAARTTLRVRQPGSALVASVSHRPPTRSRPPRSGSRAQRSQRRGSATEMGHSRYSCHRSHSACEHRHRYARTGSCVSRTRIASTSALCRSSIASEMRSKISSN